MLRAGSLTGLLRYSIFFLVLVFGLLGFSRALAFDGEGNGVYGDPYLVSDCDDLQSIGSTEDTEDKLYWLTDDIDCSATSSWNAGAGFAPIEYFRGTLDGRGHTISGLFIDREEDEVGLFSVVNEAFITSLYFDETTDITGGQYVGTLAGRAGYSTIRDVRSAGSVTAIDHAGGLVGRTNGWQDDLVIEKSAFSGTVNVPDGDAGGFIGFAEYGHTLDDNHFSGTITADVAGGLIGSSQSGCGYRYINNAYVEGNITGDSTVGGLVGLYYNVTCYDREINNSVSVATLTGSSFKGGVVGVESNSSVNISNTYFDVTAAGTSDCEGVAGSGTYDCSDIAENLAPSDAPYNQWDFDDIWDGTEGVALRSPFAFLAGPSVPLSLSTVEGGGLDQVDVSWSEPESDGGFDLNNYRVEIQEVGGDWSNPLDYDNTSDTTATFYDLRLDTEYEVRVQAVTDYAGGAWAEQIYETQDSEIINVDTCAELMAFDDAAENRFATLKLTGDIDCTGTENLEPIGSSEEWDGEPYRGVFDGQAYTISGFTVDIADYEIGLFKYVSRGELKNVTLESGSITGDGSVGSLAGSVYLTDISNVHSTMDVTSSDGGAGGLVGYVVNDEQSSSVVLEYLSYDGTIECPYDCGGLFGEIEADYGRSIILRKSYSTGLLLADLGYEGSNFGGLIGDLEVYSEDDDYIGEIVIEDSYSQMNVSGWENVGGVFGTVDVNNDDYDNAIASITIDNVYASGDVVGAFDVGGFSGQLEDYYYEGEIITISDSFSAGLVVDGTGGGGSNINGFIGYYDEGDIAVDSSNNYYDNNGDSLNCSGVNELADCTSVDESSTDYFQLATNAPLDEWDFEDIWYAVDDDYPRLHGSDYERPESPSEEAVTDEDEDGKSPVSSSSDTRNGGVSDYVEENSEQNGDDLNNDGVPDSEQANVTSMIDPLTGEYAVLEVDEQCSVESLTIVAETEMSEINDADYEYPAGLMDFHLDCGEDGFTATVVQYYYGVSGDFIVRKFKPNTGYFTINSASVSDQTIADAQVKVVTYQVTDGGNLDLDGEVDGMIEDPAGLAQVLNKAESRDSVYSEKDSDMTTTVIVVVATTLFIVILVLGLRKNHKKSA